MVRKPGKEVLSGYLTNLANEMQRPHREDFLALLYTVADALLDEVTSRMLEAGFSDVRGAHGCVFGNIDPDGSRLTDLAERAHMTKQSVGEVATELERRGYLERVPDPEDGRAKIIRLTGRGREARALGFQIMDEMERDWGERFGVERVAALRDALEVITAERLGALPVI